MRHARDLVGLAVLLAVAACNRDGAATDLNRTTARSPAPGKEAVMTLTLTSEAFAAGARIPARHTADGEDLSPALNWGAAPAGCRSFALLCDDPDAPLAGGWVHWVIFNIPSTATGLPEGLPRDPSLVDGSTQGLNSWGRAGYNGPSPPRGKPHRYIFKLYALDTTLPLNSQHAKESELLAAMAGHILGETELTGLYGR
jgi:Raf kinase inhibitor-like YbhB/YbcL family protein